MTPTPLTGFIIHSCPYQEKRAIYQFFSYELGVVHGIGSRGLPLFAPICLLSSGKNSLKTFSQMHFGFDDEFCQTHLGQQASLPTLNIRAGRVQYAMLYMNEILYKLLAVENACPLLWQAYHQKICQFHHLDALDKADELTRSELMQLLRVYLREFERALFVELGVAIDFGQDWSGNQIDDEAMYRFVPEMGFIPENSSAIALAKESAKAKVSQIRYSGLALSAMNQANDEPAYYLHHLEQFGQLQKELMDYLLEYRPLHSRTLWQQSMRYQTC